jgi:isopenicillin N synthase-like dioxygenase
MAALVVPVVDVGAFRGADPAGRVAVARSFGRALEETGFVTITGHGVPRELVQGTYDSVRRFFDLALAEKRRFTAPERAKTRGYLPLGIESVAATLTGKTPPDLCEALVFASLQRERAGKSAPNYWPDHPPELAGLVQAYFDAMLGLTHTLMRMAALALDLPETWFDEAYGEPGFTLRFVNYPDQPHPPEPGQLRYGAHHDYGGLTILRQDDAPGGLQICAAQGAWHDVPPHPDSFVINVGDLMSRWTNGRWRSTLHRVLNPDRALTGSTQRLSMVAFTAPSATTEVRVLPSCVSEDRPAQYEPVNAQAYVQAKIAASHAL